MKNYIINIVIEVIYKLMKLDLEYFHGRYGMRVMNMYEDILKQNRDLVEQRTREYLQANLNSLIEEQFLHNNAFLQKIITEINRFQLHK